MNGPGVMIEGRRQDTDEGVPQGSVLSPLLANVYLHYVLDRWFEHHMCVREGIRREAFSRSIAKTTGPFPVMAFW